MGKILEKCQFGVVHFEAQCRCFSNDIHYRRIECDVPEEHNVPPYEPKHRKED